MRPAHSVKAPPSIARKAIGIIVRHSGVTRSVEPGIHNPCARDGLLCLCLRAKKHGTLYVTNDIVRRGHEHRTKAVKVL